jgi:hypothetical protein
MYSGGMNKILIFSLLILSIQASALDKTDLELSVFGLSYHTNRDYDYNEVNPGLGLNLTFSSLEKQNQNWYLSWVLSGGFYKDSYSDTATYLLVGPRLTLGYDDSFHVSGGFGVGYFEGSGNTGIGYIPVVTVGYDWFNVGITGDPFSRSETVDVGDKRVAYTKMVAVFLNLKVLTF